MATPYLTLDFNAQPATRRVHRALFAVGVVALLAGGAELAVAWLAHEQARAELASLAQRRPSGNGAHAGRVDGAALRVAAAIARDLQAPWPELMRSMEASRSSDIALVQVEPVVARDTIRITADARHADAMLDYLAQLTAQGLSEVVLTSHELRAQEPGTPIRFQAQARWTRLSARQGPSASADSATPPDLAALHRLTEQEQDSR